MRDLLQAENEVLRRDNERLRERLAQSEERPLEPRFWRAVAVVSEAVMGFSLATLAISILTASGWSAIRSLISFYAAGMIKGMIDEFGLRKRPLLTVSAFRKEASDLKMLKRPASISSRQLNVVVGLSNEQRDDEPGSLVFIGVVEAPADGVSRKGRGGGG